MLDLERLRAKLESMTDQDLIRLSPLRDQAAQQSQSDKPASPMELARLSWGSKWASPPHLCLLNLKLSQVATGAIKRLLITMPPRHGKSELTSAHFPAWYLGSYPDRRIILASYEADFAATWGRRARNILEEHGSSLFGVTVSRLSSAADRWDIEGHRGGMNTAGVGGAITGKGANLLLIDDPIKNSEEANSYVMRQKTWEWYQSTAYTRLEPDAAIVLIQTRWHSDDLAGRILAESGRGGDKWEAIDLPALARTEDPLGRQPGAALWPERFDERCLAEIRKAVGEYFFAALYQQRPRSADGDKIKSEWFRYWDTRGDYYCFLNQNRESIKGREGQLIILASEAERIQIVDCAGSSDDVKREKRGKPPSYSVISTFDWLRDRSWLIWRKSLAGRWEFPELRRRVRTEFDSEHPAWIGIEDEKTGRALLQDLRDLPTRALSPEGKDKLTRAATLLNDLEQGRVFVPADSPPWLLIALEELLHWDGHPDTPFDHGDTAAYAARHVRRPPAGRAILMTRVLVGGVS